MKKYLNTWMNNTIAILKQSNILSIYSVYRLLPSFYYPHYHYNTVIWTLYNPGQCHYNDYIHHLFFLCIFESILYFSHQTLFYPTYIISYNITFTLALHLIFNQHYPCMTVTFTITLNWIIHVHYFHFSTHFIPPCIIPMYSVSIIPVKNNLGYILSNTPVSNHIITVNTVLSTRLNSILYNSHLIQY